MSSVTSGIKTDENIDDVPYGFKVSWIEWDSDFRNSGLQHADIIVAVDGKRYLKENREREFPKAIGSYLESSFWEEQNGKHGQTISLEVFREGAVYSISGKIQEQQHYVNANNRPTLGPNGPARMSNDGFSSPWASWYENFVRHASLYLDDKRWERSVLDNLKLLAEHELWMERINYLVKNYPGVFADSVFQDWQKVRKILEGTIYTDITDKDLEYRKIGEQRKLLVKEAALKAKGKFTESLSSKIIPAFPAVDPVHGNVAEVAGKVIVLPGVGYKNFINDLGKSYAVIGSGSDGYYFIHLNSQEMDIFFKTLFHYQAQVTPDIPEKFQFVAEILNEPAMLSYGGRPVKGIMVKVVAGLAGEEDVFVDISKTDGTGRAVFEGEEALSAFADYPLPDTASPEQVIEAMIGYIKLGDQKSWKKLFATWQIYAEWDGPPFMDMGHWWHEESYQNTWEKSRRLILKDIYDARVLYTGPVKTVVNENKETGVPKVEQVKIIVDHIGRIDGVYRSLSNVYVHRKWILQRLNAGSWKIKELQGL